MKTEYEHEEKFEIIVKTNKKLTNDEIWEVINDFRGRLQGYYTECPKSLIGSDMEIKYVRNK